MELDGFKIIMNSQHFRATFDGTSTANTDTGIRQMPHTSLTGIGAGGYPCDFGAGQEPSNSGQTLEIESDQIVGVQAHENPDERTFGISTALQCPQPSIDAVDVVNSLLLPLKFGSFSASEEPIVSQTETDSVSGPNNQNNCGKFSGNGNDTICDLIGNNTEDVRPQHDDSTVNFLPVRAQQQPSDWKQLNSRPISKYQDVHDIILSHEEFMLSLELSLADFKNASGPAREQKLPEPLESPRLDVSEWPRNGGAQLVSGVRCGSCQQLFGDVSSMTRHSISTHRNTTLNAKFKCSICADGFVNKRNRKRHMYVVHAPGGPSCNVCIAPFNNKWSYATHLRRVHSIGAKSGEGIGSNSEQSSGTNKETSKQDAGSIVFKRNNCGHCSAMFRTKGNLNRHVQLAHFKTKNFACPLCDGKFGTSSNLRVHMFVHRSEPSEFTKLI